MKKSRWIGAATLQSLLLFFATTVPALAQNERITLDLNNVPLISALDSIQQHSGYRFSYSLELVPLLKESRVSIHFKNHSIEKVLSLLFAEKGIKYRVIDNMVLLSKSPPASTKRTDLPGLIQVIKGKVVDKESHSPLANVSITVLNASMARGAITDSNGFFLLEIPVGRQSLQFSSIGYQEQLAADIIVVSGKETFLTIELQESVKTLREVVVSQGQSRNRALNSMATVSAHVVTPEDASRYAAGYNDPARMVSALAGVLSGGNGRNNIIIRGNAPGGLLWKLEGIEIPAPNHFSRGQGDAGGLFSIVGAGMLSNFDFFTGAFPAEYGNALAGIMDLNLRKGNSDKAEYGLQVGVIGSEASLEGPISKSKKSSYLLNYRYGNLQFLSEGGIIHLPDNQKSPVFQDFSMHINFPTRKAGEFSIFGIGGISKTGYYSSNDSMMWRRDPGTQLDKVERHLIGVMGVKHTLLLPNKKTYLKSTLALSYQSDRLTSKELDNNYHFWPKDSSRYSYPTIRFTTSVNHKFNSGSVVRVGMTYSHFFFSIYGMNYDQNRVSQVFLDQHGNTGSIEGFFQWKYHLSPNFEINSGLHATSFLLNHKYAIEPRLGGKLNTGSNSFLSFGFGMHSRIEPISMYFTRIKEPGGAITQPNLDLKLTKAMHYVLGYEKMLSKNLKLKAEIYYQYLYHIPVVDNPGSIISTINNLYGLTDTAYASKGKGYNKGIEITVEKFFSKNYYFLLSGSVFDSKYKPANGQTYNTRFNTNYLVNALAGKDFNTGALKQNTFSINVRATSHGGFRYSPGRVATDNSGKTYLFFPPEETYSQHMSRYMRFDAGLKFRKNNRSYSWILSLDVQNITNRENVLEVEPNVDPRNIIHLDPTVTDLGIIPVLNLKVEF